MSVKGSPISFITKRRKRKEFAPESSSDGAIIRKKHAKKQCRGIKLNCENCHVSYYEYDPTKTTICKRCLKMSESEEKKRKLSEIKKEKELENKKKQKIFDEEFEKSQNYIGQLDDDFSD